MKNKAFLPDKNGNYKETTVPKYILNILENVYNQYDYIFKLRGVNPVRPAYGIEADLLKLEKWAKRYHSDFTIKHIHEERKNYYGLFELTDPVAFQLEKAGLLK